MKLIKKIINKNKINIKLFSNLLLIPNKIYQKILLFSLKFNLF
jgi:hypothetical protein